VVSSVQPHNPATRFEFPSATVVSAEPFSHGTGTLQCLQKEMVTYRHWSVSLWRHPDDVSHCRILSPDKTARRLISATLCRWRCCFVADQLWFMTRIREEVELSYDDKISFADTLWLLKAGTSTNTKPEVVFSGRGCHLQKWIWCHISAMYASIWTKFGSRMQNNTPITEKWSWSKLEVKFQYGRRFFFPKMEVVISRPSIEICQRNVVCW